ncbi:MAG: 3-isopropylmalate dehydratase [Deltaproteobacteria bacterium]|nr:3-isopropylmalate dehydratase [Deltaproteobacteria bacterium]
MSPTSTSVSPAVQKRDPLVRFSGRVLYLTNDLELLERQLKGEVLRHDPDRALIDNISTDELTPGWVCFWYDETLGDYCLVGLRGGKVGKDSIKNARAAVMVSGLSKGCGSSRETAPYAEKVAGVQLVVAKTIEKIYGQNCRNIGLLTTTDFSVLARIEKGEAVPLAEFTEGLNDIEKGIVEYGGLFTYNKARLAGEVTPPAITTAPRPMTLVEKIVASRAIADARSGTLGVPAVEPGDALFCRTDVRFSHDYTTAMCDSLFTAGYGKDAKLRDPSSVFAMRDHLTFRNKIMSDADRAKGLHVLVDNLGTEQERFVKKHGIRYFGLTDDGTGSQAICHNAVMEELGGPGDIIVGTDSHTCTAGALGAFAFGVGSTDMANAWYTADIQVKVPASVKYLLTGKPAKGVTAKDVMLYVMSQQYAKDGHCIGKVLELSGPGLAHLNMDERATLTNLAVECGATTGIIEADLVTTQYLMKFRGWSEERASRGHLKADPGAHYDATFTIDLAAVPQMVATPGDPRNGVAVEALRKAQGAVKIDIAYGGSCTGGKMADMDMYAEVLAHGLERGMRVKDGVQLFIQFGSQRIKRYAVDKGYPELFAKAGAHVIEPSCGACINAGPGVSRTKETVTVSAINRNFPGRSGPGQVYLASPRVVAASALSGTIVTPEELFG